MAMTGPVPRPRQGRTTQHRANIHREIIVKGRVKKTPGVKDWHAIAKTWYHSLGRSAQSAVFEPSDWSEARFTAQLMSDFLKMDPAEQTGAMLDRIQRGMDRALSNHMIRLRAHVHITRELEDAVAEDEGPARVDRIKELRERARQPRLNASD